jgi:hypothetical protein
MLVRHNSSPFIFDISFSIFELWPNKHNGGHQLSLEYLLLKLNFYTMKNEMSLDWYSVEELSINESLTVDAGSPIWPFVRDYIYGKMIDSLIDGFNNAQKNGYTQSSGSSLMHTALH